MHKIGSLGSDGVTREFHPTAQVDVGVGTVGQFFTDYLAENSRIIPILGQISINRSVQVLGLPDFNRTSGPMFIENLQVPYDNTGWGHGVTSNHTCPVTPWVPYHNISVTWHGAVPVCSSYFPRSA